VTVNPDGTFVQQSGNSGTWECTNVSKGTVTFRWKNGGYVNRMVLSDDGTRLASTDPSQKFVTATRTNPEAQLSAMLQGKKGNNSVPRVVETPNKSPALPPKPPISLDTKTEAMFQRGYDLFVKKAYEHSKPGTI